MCCLRVQVVGVKVLMRIWGALGCEGLTALSHLLQLRIQHLLQGSVQALSAGKLPALLLEGWAASATSSPGQCRTLTCWPGGANERPPRAQRPGGIPPPRPQLLGTSVATRRLPGR